MNPMEIYFPGGKKVAADYNGFTITTDQPIHGGGEGTAPAPYDLFLASLGTCAGIFVKAFLDSRGLASDDVYLTQELKVDPVLRKIAAIEIKIRVPEDFPEKYRPALARAAEQCAVKQTIMNPPQFLIETETYKPEVEK